jgi:hypothetical protein
MRVNILRNTLTGLITAAILISLSCRGQSVNLADNHPGNTASSNSSVEQRTARKTWEQIYFESIDRRTKSAELNILRETEVPKDSLEIRIWAGVDPESLRGFVLRRSGAQWSAVYLPSSGHQSKLPEQSIPLSEPRSGWESLWQELNQQDILTLPDASDVGADNVYPDALGIVVEVRSGDGYRSYNYNGFDTSEHPEAKKINIICKTVSKEFGVALC